MALSVIRRDALFCPLLDSGGQRWLVARNGLSAFDPSGHEAGPTRFPFLCASLSRDMPTPPGAIMVQDHRSLKPCFSRRRSTKIKPIISRLSATSGSTREILPTCEAVEQKEPPRHDASWCNYGAGSPEFEAMLLAQVQCRSPGGEATIRGDGRQPRCWGASRRRPASDRNARQIAPQ
jgi:hypothetical protein